MTRPADRAAAVRLTPLVDDDSPVLFRWINDRELVQMSSAFKPVSIDDHRRWFDAVRQRPDVRIFAIRPADSMRLLGTCQLLNIDRASRSAELQIRIGDPEWRGRGVGTAAVQALVDVGFKELHLQRITLHTFVSNRAAQRLYEKAGFKRIGVLKAAAIIDGAPVDAIEMELAGE